MATTSEPLEGACFFCKSRGSSTVAQLTDYFLVRCADCGLLRTAFPPSGGSFQDLYSEDYFIRDHPGFFARNACALKAKRARCEDELDRLSPHIPSGGELLDVGCGLGTFMEAAVRRGYRVLGMEPSPVAAEQTRLLKLPVQSGWPEGKNRFDAVTMLDVFEHVPDPAAVLENCREHLKDGGILLIETINEDGLLPRLTAAMYSISGGRFRWPMESLHPPQHLFHPTRKQLISFLGGRGFEILSVEPNDLPLAMVGGGVFRRSVLAVLGGVSAAAERQWCLRILLRKKRAGVL